MVRPPDPVISSVLLISTLPFVVAEPKVGSVSVMIGPSRLMSRFDSDVVDRPPESLTLGGVFDGLIFEFPILLWKFS